MPAGRALSWQLTNAAGEPVVRERYWVTMQAGEVRVCASCHGINTADQAGNPPPSNELQALRKLLGQLKAGGASFRLAKRVSSPHPLRRAAARRYKPDHAESVEWSSEAPLGRDGSLRACRKFRELADVFGIDLKRRIAQ